MAQAPHPDQTQTLPHAGLRCPTCDYDLTGSPVSPDPRCPECGQPFDPVALRRKTPWWKRRPTRRVTFTVVLLAVYLPNTWVFWIDYPWRGGYRLHWVKLFPLLPSLLLLAWGSHLVGVGNNIDTTVGYVLMSLLTAGVVGLGVWVGRRSWLALILVAVIVFALQVCNALACHALFRA